MNPLQKYNIDPEEWQHIGEWPEPCLHKCYWAYWYDPEIAKQMDFEMQDTDMFYINGFCFWKKKCMAEAKEKVKKQVEDKNLPYFENIFKTINKIAQEHMDFKPKGSILLEQYKSFNRSCERMLHCWAFSVLLTYPLDDIIKQNPEVTGLMQIKEPLLMKHQKRILELRKNLPNLSEEEKQEQYQDILKEYGWVGTHGFWGNPYTMKDLLEDLENMKELDPPEKKDIPENLKFLVKICEEVGFLRQYSAEAFTVGAFRNNKLMTDIADQFGITFDELLDLTHKEILNFLETNQKPDINIIKARQKQNICMPNYDVIIDKDDIDYFDKLMVPKSEATDTLKGTVASKGKATGKAKIFLTPHNVSKMKEGDILVTTMTTPDYVPLMRKAAAIVTDFGGLLSHASIVSREMGKPCIVGTKFATRIFQDKDVLEVDAETGIVRKV